MIFNYAGYCNLPLPSGHDADPTHFENMPLVICVCVCVSVLGFIAFVFEKDWVLEVICTLLLFYLNCYVIHCSPSLWWSFMALSYT